MFRSLKICAQVESGTIVAGYSAVAPPFKRVEERRQYVEFLQATFSFIDSI